MKFPGRPIFIQLPPDLTKAKAKPGLGKYGAIFFEDFRSYLEMDPWNRELLDKYCKTYNAGIIAVVPPTTEDGFDFSGIFIRSDEGLG